MTSKVITEVMTSEGGCQREGDTLRVPDDIKATLFVSVGSETLVIEKVSAVTVGGEALVVRTGRDERYAVVAEDVRAMRFASKGGRAGYAAD
jgi:hypothetical protein